MPYVDVKTKKTVTTERFRMSVSRRAKGSQDDEIRVDMRTRAALQKAHPRLRQKGAIALKIDPLDQGFWSLSLGSRRVHFLLFSESRTDARITGWLVFLTSLFAMLTEILYR